MRMRIQVLNIIMHFLPLLLLLQILSLGPTSTDTLVTAQYGPVSEIAYNKPSISDEEETRKLMEHKETWVPIRRPARN